MTISSFQTEQRPAKEGTVKLRPRNAMMDKLVKHVNTSPEYSFEAVCKTMGETMKKAKAKA